jgi:ferredoxin
LASGDVVARRVQVDRNICLGNALCVDLAPEFFELDDADVSVVKGAPTEDDVWAAMRACPTQAIFVSESD